MIAHLIQPRELYGPPERLLELETCQINNDRVFDLVTALPGQPTFDECLAACKSNAVNVIANGDICFDLEGVDSSRLWLQDKAFALSRWDVIGGVPTLWDHRDSQDAWVIWGTPRPMSAPFQLGKPGCDNRFARVLLDAGYEVLNPSKTIKAYHLHESGYRTYGAGRGKPKMDRIPGPYHFIQPTEL